LWRTSKNSAVRGRTLAAQDWTLPISDRRDRYRRDDAALRDRHPAHHAGAGPPLDPVIPSPGSSVGGRLACGDLGSRAVVFVGSHQLEALGVHARGEVVVQRRRLVDRFGLFVCESICRDASVPDWVRRGLPVMPEIMTVSDRLSDASCEHAPMPPMRQRMGETFRASNR